MYDWTITTTLALCSLVILYIGRRALEGRTSCPLPPGPPGLPWVGNVIGVNASAPWITYAEWASAYGDIIYSRQLGKDVIILNSEEIAKDLLEGRSWNYSDRPHLATAEMCGLGHSSVLLPYGDRWRLHRRFIHQTFHSEVAIRFLPLLRRKGCHLLRQLLSSPKQLNDHVMEYAISVMLNSVYDYDPASRKDEFVENAEMMLNIAVPALRPDIALVAGAFPFLFYLPSWFPGMSFKRQMAIAREFSKQNLERPFEYSLQKIAHGNATSSMVHDALREMKEKELSPNKPWMQALKEASGTAFLVASETTHAVLMTFFLTMVLNPTAQEKAQAQIDAVVGKDRLPTIDDRPLLPFTDAIYWETLRCYPITPLMLPHSTMEDDIYGKFHIPKGATLIANIWSMTHNESKYPNPHAFIPERFLNDNGSLKPSDIKNLMFGFGRRICVGRHFADTSLWSAIAMFLAVFKILKSVDENGVEIPVEPRFLNGISVHPLPFEYRIVPRFPGMNAEKLEQLIAASDA